MENGRKEEEVQKDNVGTKENLLGVFEIRLVREENP